MRFQLRRRNGFAYIQILLAVAVVALLWWQGAKLLAPVGTFLDVGEAPQKVDAVVILAGGWDGGGRVLKAGQLVRAGFAPYALMSGPHQFYNQPECNAAIPFGVQNGFPAEYFQCAPNHATSTEDEAAALIPELRRRGVKRFIVVSVDTHLRRARAIFLRQLPADMEIHFVASESPGFRLSEWWKAREGRKTILLEWTKVLTFRFGI